MRSFLSALFILAFFSISYAQSPVVDPRPQAKIYVIDPQSGQQVPAYSDAAILFKNALLDLVMNSRRSNSILRGAVPQSDGRVYTVTQMGAQTNIDGYQVSLDYVANDPSQPVNVYTFAYYTDDHALYFYDPAGQQWLLESIDDSNMENLRKTAEFNKVFNEELANQGGQPGPDVSVDLNAPVDANVSANVPPPAMPDYDQPECPTDGYLWQPGYWAYSPYRNDYYWVPGAWVAPPSAGVLWTPPYWGYEGSSYVFHVGYWGNHIGFYGGINYGYGYSGHGYYGGEWRGGRFNYNTAVVHVNTTVVHNTYVNTTVINNVTINNHTSFVGRGGVEAKPTPEEVAASHETHIKPTAEQNANQLSARGNPNQFNKANGGGKPVFASPKAIPYHPQSNPGLRGNNNMKQPTTPAHTKGAPVIPGKPQALPGSTVKPQGKPTSPAKPTGLPGGTTKPQGQQSNPVKPEGQPANPSKPQGLPGGPTKPQGEGTNVVKPAQQPATAGKPGPTNTQGNGKRKSKKDSTKMKPVTKPVTQ